MQKTHLTIEGGLLLRTEPVATSIGTTTTKAGLP